MRSHPVTSLAIAILVVGVAGGAPAQVVSSSKTQIGNAPGTSQFGTLTLCGPSFTGTSNYGFQINDAGPSATFPSAPGTAGTTVTANNQASGWSLMKVVILQPPLGPVTPGDFYWDATPSDPLTIHLITLLGPYSQRGMDGPFGPMADFDPTQTYRWPIVTYEGAYKTHNTAAYPNGPPTDAATLTASTVFATDATDNGFTRAFENPHPGTFGLSFNEAAKELDLTYTQPQPVVPEPGTFALVAAGLLAVWRGRYRRHCTTAA